MTLPRKLPQAKSPECQWHFIAVIIATLTGFTLTAWAETKQPIPSDANIAQAFASCSMGFSTDELLISDDLRSAFLAELFDDDGYTAAQERQALLKLIGLRKAGKLTTRATRRGPSVDEGVAPIAEIAARVVTDRHRISTDTLLADPDWRLELQREAEKISPGVDAYSVRKSILQLRKKRALKPELVLRVADWQREIKTYTLQELRTVAQAGEIPSVPGIYLFRNLSGYLYIGEASNLANRLQQHLLQSDRVSLAEYLISDDADEVTVELHQFPKNSPAAKVAVRRAYESELIRSRTPKFNVRP